LSSRHSAHAGRFDHVQQERLIAANLPGVCTCGDPGGGGRAGAVGGLDLARDMGPWPAGPVVTGTPPVPGRPAAFRQRAVVAPEMVVAPTGSWPRAVIYPASCRGQFLAGVVSGRSRAGVVFPAGAGPTLTGSNRP